MPFPSRLMLRLSLCYFLAAFTLGAVMLAHKAWPIHTAVWSLLPLHIEFALFGWIIQFTMGTAYWILPRYLEGPPRGSGRAARAMVGLLNAGILAVAASAFWDQPLLEPAGRLMELAAVGIFVALHWKRVISYAAS